jgi:hypothetical protein
MAAAKREDDQAECLMVCKRSAFPWAGILFVLRTGIRWHEAPGELGCSGKTCRRRLRNRCGQPCHGAGQLDWSRAALDTPGTMPAAGAAANDVLEHRPERIALGEPPVPVRPRFSSIESRHGSSFNHCAFHRNRPILGQPTGSPALPGVAESPVSRNYTLKACSR